ncbi:MAG: precorrin-2 dehydrogenase/sirohydrochlorin ferrochelatase family protein [Stellaceae bacterium]
MLPLSLELSRLRIALIGNGAAALRRLAWLEEAGAVALGVFAAAPSPELARAAGGRLLRHWPSRAALSDAQLVFIADVPRTKRQSLARAARAAGAMLHVEDAPALSDVHAPAVLRRGDLTFAISTCGAAPGLAAELKVFLGEIFGPEWQGRLDEIAALRQRAHAAGANNQAVRQTIAARLAAGWLEPPPKNAANDRGRIPNRRGGRS